MIKFPRHAASLTLTHNDHKTNYETVAEYCEGGHWMPDDDWLSPEQKAKAIATNEMWEMQWYPDTPVGFCKVAACDLDVLLKYCEDK